MPWYKAGTVSVTQNFNAVIGTGTAVFAKPIAYKFSKGIFVSSRK